MSADAKGPLPKVGGFVLVVGADGRVKVDDWNGLTAAQQRAVAEYVTTHYEDGRDVGNA